MQLFYRSKSKYKSGVLAGAVMCALCLLLDGCSSSVQETEINATHGAHSADGAVYGSGPDRTEPFPQSEPVNLNGVKGAAIRYEEPSRGGNKDYQVFGENYEVWRGCDSYLEIGTASWYGPGFHGNKTSNGEVYNQKGFSAAHKNLPLPSYVKVTNLENGRAVVVRVNDRGPFHGTRIIDLSEGAARAIDMTRKGTAKVKVEYLKVQQGNVIANRADTSRPGSGPAHIMNPLPLGADSPHKVMVPQIVADNSSKAQAAQTESLAQASPAVQATPAPSPSPAVQTQVQAKPQQQYEVTYADNSSVPALPSLSRQPEVLGGAYVQIFSTGNQSRAGQVQKSNSSNTVYPVTVAAEEGLYRVRIGPVPEQDLARVVSQMQSLGFKDAFVKHI